MNISPFCFPKKILDYTKFKFTYQSTINTTPESESDNIIRRQCLRNL